jgi:hypothetical protein
MARTAAICCPRSSAVSDCVRETANTALNHEER